ncbi:MAG: putative DNA binding domain-containing protein [Candidatus Latescibacterota bacterium]|jgi:hypothetical protein
MKSRTNTIVGMHANQSNSKKRRIRALAILTLVVAAAVITAMVELTSLIRSEMAQSLIDGAADRAELAFRDQLDKLFAPLQRKLAIVERWGERGSLKLDDHVALNDLFVPMMEQLPWTTSMMIATENGVEYMLMREDSTWVTRATDAGERPGRVRWRRWAADGALLEDWQEELDYDPRKRPWYRAAVEGRSVDERGISWTEPYRFFTTGQMGVTLSRMWRTKGERETVHVTGIDVPLDSILGFTDEGIRGLDGYTFLINRDERVVDAAGADGAVRTASHLELDFLNGWRKGGKRGEAPFPVNSRGEAWWVDFREVSDDSASLWLAIGVPEASLAGDLRGRQHRVALIVLGVLVLGVLLTLVVTQSRPAEAGEGIALEDERALLDLIATGEGDRLEFKSTLRWNLNTGKPGKEVEISWLKTVVAYLNTEGGVLIVGVNDDGEVSGIESDNFANEDKFLLHYNNLIKQHIGLEFADYVSADIATVKDKKIFVVQCRPASEPVFLKQGKEEKYYVRVGPSSRALSTSQVVERVRKRS